MALSFTLVGPVPLNAQSIGSNILPGMPGVYVLGEPHQQGGVAVRYVGRSDEDLAGRLKQQTGYYSHFVYDYAASAHDAFIKECEMYHEWQHLIPGQIHPARPQGSWSTCPWGCP
jgi:hypothetical protein